MNLEPGVLQVNLDDIIPNRFQPRIAFDEQGLKELSDSIKEHGIIQPLVLRKLGDKYEIIAGERRYKAATMAGLVTVPAVISNLDDNKSAEVALVENIQRRDLTPIEEAKSYKQLLDKGYLTQEQLAKRMGVSQPAIANKLRLLNLDEEVQQALLSEKISERHARALLQVSDKNDQKKWLDRIINERLTVRQLDQEIKKTMDGEETSSEDVPIVELAPSIEDIKAKAEDINPVVNKNIEDIMKPGPAMEDFNNNFNPNPIIMDVKKEEEPKEEVPPVQTTNRFFNFSDTDPLNMDVDEINPPNPFNNKDIEIIDMPILNDEKELPTDIIDDIQRKEEEKQEELNTDFDRNPNNRFFTPVLDESSMDSKKDEKQEETLIDPMSQVDKLEETLTIPNIPTLLSNSEVLEGFAIKEPHKDTVAKINETINRLKDEGLNFKVEESDLKESYEIKIIIEK